MFEDSNSFWVSVCLFEFGFIALASLAAWILLVTRFEAAFN